MYKIYISSAAGLDYTGLWYNEEEEAKKECAKLNKQNDSPYCHYSYVKS